jgi:Icc-related predicted phosphoesterase
VVIVSHHAPSIQSISPQHRDDPLGAAFASNLEGFVRWTNAVLWVHGHIHETSDYIIGNTPILCNPLGYPDERNARFDPHLTIDI